MTRLSKITHTSLILVCICFWVWFLRIMFDEHRSPSNQTAQYEQNLLQQEDFFQSQKLAPPLYRASYETRMPQGYIITRGHFNIILSPLPTK